jgi:hypothetical protein
MTQRSGFGWPALAGFACLYLAATARPAVAQIVPDTLAQVTSGLSSLPLLSRDQFDATLHVAYRDSASFIHAWRTDTGWLSEIAVPSTGYTRVDDAVSWDVKRGVAALVWDAGDGSLRFASGQSGVWSSETIVTNPGWTYAPSLVLDSGTGAPVVAFLAREPRVGHPNLIHIELSRRDTGGWTVTEMDTSSFDVAQPSLAVTSDGQPRVALSRRIAAGGGAGGLYYIEAATVTGPFTWTLVDPLAAGTAGNGPGTASLVLDRSSDEPRLAYSPFIDDWGLRYAYRAAGVWTTQTLDAGTGEGTYKPVEKVSLAFTPSGDPRIVRTQVYTIVANEVAGAADVCIVTSTSSRWAYLYKRVGSVGTGAFTSERVGDAWKRTSALAVASVVGDGTDVVWRDPPAVPDAVAPECAVLMIHGTEAPTASVPPVGPPVTRFAIGPNPLRAGRTMTIRLAVARAQTVELTVIDIAGRRVTSTEARVDAGASSLVWTPDGLRAGVYRVIARAGGARIGTAPVVVLR